MQTEEKEKKETLEEEIKRLNKELRHFKGLPGDWHKENESQRMKRNNCGRYYN